MEPPSSLVDETRTRVFNYLHELGAVETDADGDLFIHSEGLSVFVRVESLGAEHTVVRVFCHPLTDVIVSPDLCQYVATENSYRFGKLWVARTEGECTGTLFLDHTMLGTHLDPDELVVAVRLLSNTAHVLEDLSERFCRPPTQ